MSLEISVAIVVSDTIDDPVYVRCLRQETVMPATPDGEDAAGTVELARAALSRMSEDAHATVHEQLAQMQGLLES